MAPGHVGQQLGSDLAIRGQNLYCHSRMPTLGTLCWCLDAASKAPAQTANIWGSSGLSSCWVLVVVERQAHGVASVGSCLDAQVCGGQGLQVPLCPP